MKNWLDGPQFVKWLEAHGLKHYDQLGPGTARRISDWKNGARANVYTADVILVKLGHHLNDLPDSMYATPPRYGVRKPIPPGVKEAVRRDRKAGHPRVWVARKYNVGLASVTRWAK